MEIQTCEDIAENQVKALLNDKLRRFMETSGIYILHTQAQTPCD